MKKKMEHVAVRVESRCEHVFEHRARLQVTALHRTRAQQVAVRSEVWLDTLLLHLGTEQEDVSSPVIIDHVAELEVEAREGGKWCAAAKRCIWLEGERAMTQAVVSLLSATVA